MAEKYNISRLVIEGLQARGSQPALKFAELTFTGQDLVDRINVVVARIAALGIAPGDRVLLVNDSDIYFPVFYLALTHMECVVVPCASASGSQFGMDYLIQRTRPRYVITQDVQHDENATQLDETPYSISAKAVQTDSMAEKLAKLGTASLMFTSGTTGVPKGVLVTHENLCTTLRKNIDFQNLSRDTVELNTLPLTHSFGLGQLHATLAAQGMAIVLPGLANMGRVFKMGFIDQATSFPTTPAGLSIMTGRYKDVFQEKLASLKTIMVNSAPLPPDLARTVIDLLPQTRLLVYYGLTEASRTTYADLSGPDAQALSSVGHPMGDTVVSLLPDTDEVTIIGSNVSPGYFYDCDSPLKMHEDGVLHTGDKGQFDPENRLTIIGRLSDEINIGGYKIDPLEIERLVLKLSGIDQACLTVAQASHGLTETILLVQSDVPVDLNEVSTTIATSVEPFKVPKQVIQVPKIPTGLNGKLNRASAQNLAEEHAR